MKPPRWFVVITAEYGEKVAVLDFGQGPIEYGCDVKYVYTRTTRRAKILAVRALRRDYRGKRKPDYLSPGENPFRGMKAGPVTCCIEGCNKPPRIDGYCCPAHQTEDEAALQGAA